MLSAAEEARKEHVPAVVHVVQMTQPLGHSTSGSHERYKPPARLAFEREYDPIRRMRDWILEEGLAGAAELDAVERAAEAQAEDERAAAWERYTANPRRQAQELAALIDAAAPAAPDPRVLQRSERGAAQRRLADAPADV